tara:strand:+ start:249 stop:713 length:465 start_codon:yes stop_codon:yes gene_type:complete
LKTLILLLSCFSISLYGQQAALSSGLEGRGTGGTFSASAGLPGFTFYADATGSLALGVQHPWESFSLSFPSTFSLQGAVHLYPVPATDRLCIRMDSLKDGYYQVFDGGGRLVQKGPLRNSVTEIQLSALQSGHYHISIFQDHSLSGIFPFTKIH